MQMLADARTGGLAEIEPHVDALTVKVLLEDSATTLHKVHDFMGFRAGELRQLGNMAVRTNHDVPVIVGIPVHDDKSASRTMQDKTFLIFFRAFRQTEDTGIGLRPQNIFDAPRRPKLFHGW